jgi:hypothetical protein
VILRKVLHWIVTGIVEQEATCRPTGDSVITPASLALILSNKQKRNLYLARLRFTFAMTLTRHSRHPAARASNAFFDQPCEFHELPRDANPLNWRDRAERNATYSRVFTNELAECGLVFWKYGQFAWINWDLRERLRSLLFQLDEKVRTEAEGELADGEEGVRRLFERSLRERHAWTHHMIALWYFQAFRASLFPDPLKESIYHHIQAIRHADTQGELLSRPMSDKSDLLGQADLIRISLRLIAKELAASESTLRFWQVEPNVFSWERVSALLEKVTIFENLPHKGKAATDPTSLPISQFFEGEWKSLEKAFTRFETLCRRDRGEIVAMFQESGPSPEQDKLAEMPLKPPCIDASQNFFANVKALVKQLVLVLSSETKGSSQNFIFDGLKFTPQEAAELICAAYPLQSPNDLSRRIFVLERALAHPESIKPVHSPLVQNIVSQWLRKGDREHTRTYRSGREIANLIRLLIGVASLTLDRGTYWKMIEKAFADDFKNDTKTGKWRKTFASMLPIGSHKKGGESGVDFDTVLWRHAAELCEVGLDLCKRLPAGFPDEYFAAWSAVRFHNLCAVALGELRTPIDAHRNLNEACSWIGSDRRLKSDRAELGIVSLRRAGVFFVQYEMLREGEPQASPNSPRDRVPSTAALDDSWSSLQYTQHYINDRLRSAWLWSALYVSQLKVLAEYARIQKEFKDTDVGDFAPVTLHNPKITKGDFYRILGKALTLPNTESYRNVLIGYYFLAGIEALQEESLDSEMDETALQLLLERLQAACELPHLAPGDSEEGKKLDLLQYSFACYVYAKAQDLLKDKVSHKWMDYPPKDFERHISETSHKAKTPPAPPTGDQPAKGPRSPKGNVRRASRRPAKPIAKAKKKSS